MERAEPELAISESSSGWRRRHDRAARASRRGPLHVAALWIATVLVHIADQVVFPPDDYVSAQVSSILHLSGGILLASLLASAILSLRGRTWAVATSIMTANLVAALAWFATQFLIGPEAASTWIAPLAIDIWLAFVVGRTIWVGSATVAPIRRVAAIAAIYVVASLPPFMNMLNGPFRRLSAVANFHRTDSTETDRTPYIDPEALWGAQPALVEQALSTVARRTNEPGQTYVVAIAAQGSQTLFAREVAVAARVLSRRFIVSSRPLILSNGEVDLAKRPLATNTNLRALLRGLAEQIDRKRDLLVIYLAAHGGREAYLSTDLPDYTELDPVSAESVRAALDASGIDRRVVIVSACFAGSWIKPLATDNTIVVAAAAAHRTSFGCSDDRRLTYFGEAFLEGSSGSGISLASAFASTKVTVSRWEARDRLTPSNPQAFVGRNMKSVWSAAARDGAAK